MREEVDIRQGREQCVKLVTQKRMWFFDVTTWQEKRENNEQITNSGQISHSARNSLEFNKMTGMYWNLSRGGMRGLLYQSYDWNRIYRVGFFLKMFWGNNGTEFMTLINNYFLKTLG